MTAPNVRNRDPPKDGAEACVLGRQFGFGKGTTFWAGTRRRRHLGGTGRGDAADVDISLMSRGGAAAATWTFL